MAVTGENKSKAIIMESSTSPLRKFQAGDLILLVFSQPSHTRVFALHSTAVLGRACEMECEVVNLTKYRAYELGVSRCHAMLEVTDDGVLVSDLGSSNGTYLNRVRLEPNQAAILNDGDEVCLGQMAIRVYFAEQGAEAELTSSEA
jgi:hypothetical protein